jgi:ABC-2 type transport system permease protein
MRGFLPHLLLSLKLNFRNPQAVVFGYVVPIFFLIVYGSVLRRGTMPMEKLAGQFLTITVLGGACFGMPIGFVSERERGVWRRYRLTPLPTWAFLASVLVGRYLIVLSGAVLQIALAMTVYKMAPPRDPLGLFIAFTAICFALLGIGLVISMLANSTHAVQAMGQSIFLPMILIGGVGVPLEWLPDWAKHVAAFLPGRYAVQAIERSVLSYSQQLSTHTRFNLVALAVIGLAASFAAAKLFRWENGQKLPRRGMLWVLLSIGAWIAVGLIAEKYHYVIPEKRNPERAPLKIPLKKPSTNPAP